MIMAGRYILTGLIVILLAANAVRGVAAQQCESASIKTYVERRENATRAVLNDIMMIFGPNISSQTRPGTTREEALYDSLTDSFGLDKSNDSFDAFSTALTAITDAYFQSCFGPIESQPSLADGPELIHMLLSDLFMFTDGRNQSLLTPIRNIFGRLTCLIDRYNESSSPTNPPAADCSDSSTLTILNFRQCINSSQIQPIFGLGPLVVVKQTVVQSRRCVGFVVDDTGSMGEEIASVRTLILNFIAAEQNLPACYVLVTFNDYGAATPLGNLGTIRVYDPQIFFSTNQTPTITRTGGAAVYGANELIADVNGLHAHGGGDCPEYGMIGILQAISSIQSVQGLVIPQQGNLHHIIVLTDASAKDDSNYTTVISAAAAARVTVHFFYSDSGCGSTMFGHYEDVRIASGGIKVTNFADFDAFGTFIQLYNEAVAAGSTSSKRKRQSSTGDIFSIYSTCHNFNTSLFTPSLALLVRTSQPSVTITRPDGTTHSLTVGGDLGLFQESNPIAGMWTACASPGTLQVAVNAPIVIELEVSFTKKTESGEILPTSEIPSACTTGAVFVRTPQLPLISLNHTVYLEFVEEDSSVAESTILTECAGVFSGEVTFPGSLVFYQLRGHDIQANSFAHVIPGTERRFKSPSLALSLANFDRMPVNPGISSFHKLWLQYTDDSGPTLKPFLQAGEPQGVSLQYYQLPTSISPSERRLVVVELTGSSMLTVGNNLTLTANVTENCTDVAVKSSYLVTVYQPLPLSVANITSTGKRSLVVHWNPLPGLDVHRYKLILDYDNGTVITTFLTPTTLTTITDILTPYQRMFISLAVINSSGDIVAFAAPRPFRSREGVSGPVTRVVATPTSNYSARISWDPPELPNGVITSYYFRVERYDGQTVFVQRNISGSDPRQLEVTGLAPYERYRAVLAAENSVGRGDEKDHEFYSKQGVPIGVPRNFQVKGLTRTSAQISWDPPSVEERRGFIVNYTVIVTYSKNGETKNRSYVTSERLVNVTGLPDLARLTVTISSATEVGQGPSSPPHSFDVEIAPSEPRELTGSPQGFTAVSLNWLPPEQRNGVIRNYRLRYHNSDSSVTGEKVVENMFDGEQRPTAVVDSLPSMWDNYIFVVAASTSAGYGPDSEETSVDLGRYSAGIVAVIAVVVLVVLCSVVVCCVVFGVVMIRRKKDQLKKYSPAPEPEKTELSDIKQ